MPRSEAQKRADKKYIAKTYKRCVVNFRRENLEAMEKYKAEQGITSDSGIFNAAVMYCIKNNVDLKNSK